MLRAIIFDMDGVICHSEPMHMKAFQDVLTGEGISLLDQEYYDRYLAHDDRGSFQAIFRDRGRAAPDPEKLKNLVMRKSKAFDALLQEGLVIYPGVEPFVKKAAQHYALALATGARRLEADYVLKKSKLRDIFTAVISADDVKIGKPEPETFERALASLNSMRLTDTPEIRPAEVLVIEDSPRCIATAKRMGMKTVGMATSYKREELQDAHFVIDSFVGLELSVLEKLFG